MIGSAVLNERYERRAGEKVGYLTFSGLADTRADHNRLLGRFVCECGNNILLPAGRVLNGRKRTHCGCMRDRGAHRTHGMRESPEYSSWQAMKGRCLDPNNKDFPRWGGLGVTIYPEWINSFSAFFEYVGHRPEGTSIDRIDTMRGYEPGNVRWATPTDQQRNRRTSKTWHIKGLTFESAQEAADHFGVSEHTVWRWVNGQFDSRRNTFTPPREDCHAIDRY